METVTTQGLATEEMRAIARDPEIQWELNHDWFEESGLAKGTLFTLHQTQPTHKHFLSLLRIGIEFRCGTLVDLPYMENPAFLGGEKNISLPRNSDQWEVLGYLVPVKSTAPAAKKNRR